MTEVTVSRTCVKVKRCERFTSGRVGARIKFSFSSEWAGLRKTAVFTNGDTTIDVLNVADEITIPHEVLAISGKTLKVGVYGYTIGDNGNIEIAIPTVYGRLGSVLEGADPSGDVSIDPTLPVWAQTQAMIGNLNDLTTEAKNNLVAAINEAAQTGGGGGGISTTAKNLLITILRSGVYTADQSANITALDTALGGGTTEPEKPDVPVETTYAISNELTNCTSSNSATSAKENAAYSTTLTANDGYTLTGGTVTVTMGGVDITATAYADGVVSISAVTGNIVITATATETGIDIPSENLLGYYDMRTELTADNHIIDLSGNGRDILFYPTNGYYENGGMYRGDKASIWGSPASDYSITDGAYNKYSYGENVTMFVTISGFTSGITPLMNTGNSSTTTNQLITFQNGVILYNQNAGFNNVAGNTALTKESVTTICTVITPSEEKIYLDGVLKSTSAAKGGAFGTGMYLLMGYTSVDPDVDTKIHNAAVYNAALSDNEVATISATLFTNAGGKA